MPKRAGVAAASTYSQRGVMTAGAEREITGIDEMNAHTLKPQNEPATRLPNLVKKPAVAAAPASEPRPMAFPASAAAPQIARPLSCSSL